MAQAEDRPAGHRRDVERTCDEQVQIRRILERRGSGGSIVSISTGRAGPRRPGAAGRSTATSGWSTRSR